jgi:hypothetical protein
LVRWFKVEIDTHTHTARLPHKITLFSLREIKMPKESAQLVKGVKNTGQNKTKAIKNT